jgi:hypothetical protein
MSAPELADAETRRISGPELTAHRRTGSRPVRRTPPPPARVWPLVLAVAVGSLVAVGLGVYGRLHPPTFAAINVAGFTSGLAAKSWVASGAFVLVLVQLASARPTWRGRRGASVVHRWSGRGAVLLTVPVAVHCLYALGFQDSSPRVLVHSLLGCVFYGAFVAKMLVLPRAGLPRWSVPVLGGVLLTVFAVVWLTSALWFFTSSGPVL